MKWIGDIFCNEQFIMVAVVLNTIVMFMGGYWVGNLWFELSDALFTIIFLFEALTKISRMGWKTYWSQGWNRFDFIILVVALPSLVSLLSVVDMNTSAVLALRVMRLFKSFRMAQFIPNIDMLLKGLKMAFRASLLVVVAFAVFLIVFSILTSTIFGKVAPEYFGNPGISIYSIFRLFSVEGWYELPEAIAANASRSWAVFARCYFSVLMFLGGIIGISLINSIFVDSMAVDNNDEVMKKLQHIEDMLNSQSKESKEPQGQVPITDR